jgi:ABC-type transport system involved in multi-copper enzyme maturation permease subunit
MRILRTELARFASRPAIRIMMVLLLLVVGLAIGGVAYSARPPSAADRAAAEEFVAAQRRDCERAQQEQGNASGTSTAPSQAVPDQQDQDAKALGCDQLPTAADLLKPPFVFADGLKGWLIPLGVLLMITFFLIGATFGGAEWNSGAIVAQLVAEPRRLRVLAGKLGGLVLAQLVAGLIILALWVGGYYLVGATLGSIGSLTTSLLTSAGLTAARSLGLGLLAGVGAFAVAHTLRSTGGTLGVAFAYGVVGEFALRAVGAVFPALQMGRWLLGTHLAGWLNYGIALYLPPAECSPGQDCVAARLSIPFWQSALYLGILGVVAVGMAAVVFRRRDVT